ncbi:CRP-like cAMP-binding protein [Mariniflexile fucanivorans]|uniref:CRP-like cAMP-binding protein n=1 Tax=Mariniflexile fucanivorans TaxID=264023 RepID=A0A4R1RK51_9FLAO|nr:Crp/Fnr family transcriptional regulator [Mariniflexile fucanivorans]TCL66072.1 CRP-like cAMP-binding protein [Mariniflexile fucanivorans]
MPTTTYNHLFSIVLLNSIHPLSKSLNKFLSNALKSSHYKKGDYILRQGEVCDRLHIIRKGLVRGYFNYENNEITTWVSVDSEMVTSISGFFKKEPALENIECLEDTYTESISHHDLNFALENFKEMACLYRILLEEYYMHAEYRAFMVRIPTAKDRYSYFLQNNHPEIIKRLSKKHLASLLNMRPETLSRIETPVFMKN